MEVKKIAIAIFLGIFVGAMVVLMLTVTPLLRCLLGILVGLSIGFLCYDFKEAREKAPLAWRAAVKGGVDVLCWLKKPHPFFLLTSMFYPISALFLKLFFSSEIKKGGEEAFVAWISIFEICFFLTLLSWFFWKLMANLGSSTYRFGEDCHWSPNTWNWFSDGQGSRKIEPTYWNICRLVLKGIWITLYLLPALLLTFFWKLFKLISSHERILCAIYCAAGVTVIHILFGHQVIPFGQKIIIAMSGGKIGATIGAIQYRLLRFFLTPATNNA